MAVMVNVVGKFNDADIKKAQDELAKLGTTAKSSGKQTGDAATSMSQKIKGALIGLGIAKFTTDSVRAFAEAEQFQSRLEAAYERFPALANENIDALRGLNSELQKTTIYDDDATAGAQAILAQFKLTGQQIAELTPLMQDFATATGQDVTTAAESLGKAFMGQTRALKTVGIDFKATGDAAADFDTIVGKLREQVGGLAAKEGETATGQLRQLQNAVGDLQESVGEALMPALRAAIDVIKPIVQAFGDLPAPVRTAALAVTGFGGGLVYLVPKLKSTKDALDKLGVSAEGLGKTAGAIGVFAVAVEGLSEASARLDDALGNGEQSVNAWTDAIKSDGLGADELARARDALSSFGGVTAGFGAFMQRLSSGNVAGAIGAMKNAGSEVENLDTALSELVTSGHGDRAAYTVAQLGLSADDVAGKLPKYNDALQQAGGIASVTAQKTAELPVVLNRTKSATEHLTTAWKQLQGILAKGDAKDAATKSLKDLGKALKESQGSLKGNSDAALASREALRSSIGDIATYAQSFKNPTKQIEILNEQTKRIRKVLRENGVTPDDIRKLLGPLLTAKDKAVQAGRDIADGVKSGLQSGYGDTVALARHFGYDVASAVKAGAQSHSPSRITIEVGKDIMRGLSVGAIKEAGGTKKVIKDATKRALDGAREALADFQAKGREILDFINAIKSQVRDAGSVTGFIAGEGPTTTRGVLTSMQGRVAEAKKFADAVGKLRGLKLNNFSLQEIISAGPRDGLAIANALLSGGAGAISEVNALESQLNAAAARIGNTGSMSQYGRTGAQARGMVRTSVHVDKGAVVVQLPASVTAADRKAIAATVDDALDKVVRKIVRELDKAHR